MERDKSSSSERRKYPRLKDSVFIFGNLTSNPTGEFRAFTEDISTGGLMFETERNISGESELELEIYQPANRYKNIIFSIPVLAKVVWREEIEKDNFELGENKYRVGIKFLRIKGEDRQRIAKYVEENRAEK